MRVIAESEIMQEFLMDQHGSESGSSEVDLRIMLPDRSTVTVTVKKTSNTIQVYKSLIKRLNMSEETVNCFALFELLDYNFGKLLKFCEKVID